MIFQQPPPFEPTEFEAEAILNIGFMFADIIILVLFMVIMVYFYKKMKEAFLPIIIVYLFSLVMGIQALGHIHTHFSPQLELFFLLFQSGVFLMIVFDYNKAKKKR